MYLDSIKQWNVFVGCKFNCVYCKRSFQAQMRRQIHNCVKCGNYEPHFHPERLDAKLPDTEGDQFIWPCSSGDISFAKKDWIEQILAKIREYPDITFLFQSKNPKTFSLYTFPENVLLGITLETNRDENYHRISKAPPPSRRYQDFLAVDFPRKIVTIEPILEFDLDIMVDWIRQLHPIRVYVGYDTKKTKLLEPERSKTEQLCTQMRSFTTVKLKLLRERYPTENQ